jgi:DNA gyrase subunit A
VEEDNVMEEQIIKTEYSEVMQKSYIDYAMSVIVARALPDVRDGLKPVQRRTLYDMHELGIKYDKPYRKCARIVGDTMGKYHPHGDASIYDALVVMSQEFKKGLPLVDGHGNFGSIEGDGAAAMRYTEARLQKITQEAYLADLDKNVVDFVPNFDETEKEPEILPVKIPNLLINGADGIAVGMATSIPPHNLGEVIDAVKAYMNNPDITTEKLMEYVKGPDFPTGGRVVNKDELLEIYKVGQGKVKIRGTVSIENGKNGKDKLVITEIPYSPRRKEFELYWNFEKMQM